MLTTLLNNEGQGITLSYADGTQDAAVINQLQIQDETVAAVITTKESEERFLCRLKPSSDGEPTLDCYRESEQLNQVPPDEGETRSSRKPDRRVVDITGTGGD